MLNVGRAGEGVRLSRWFLLVKEPTLCIFFYIVLIISHRTNTHTVGKLINTCSYIRRRPRETNVYAKIENIHEWYIAVFSSRLDAQTHRHKPRSRNLLMLHALMCKYHFDPEKLLNMLDLSLSSLQNESVIYRRVKIPVLLFCCCCF